MDIPVYIAEINSFAIVVAIVGYITVFTALLLLYLIFNSIPKLYKIQLREMRRRQGRKRNANDNNGLDITGEAGVAISLALYMYFNDIHDNEDMVMTIKKVSKRYSPWSSKIYGLNNSNYRR